MKKALAAALALAALALPAAALPHPLGNFTVNRHSEIVLSGDRVYVRYALDLAEIPAYQEGSAVRAPSFAAAVADRLVLELDGHRVALTPLEHRVQARPGAGGLETLRFDAVFAAPEGSSGRTLAFRDLNFERRLGWKEIVAVATGGAEIEAADVPSTSASDALRAYPADLLTSPLDVTAARVEYKPGPCPGAAPQLQGGEAAGATDGGFESLIARGDLGAGVVLVSLLVAMFWGAAHALTPGHGKAIVAGYLVGTRGKPRHAVLLGLIVTATHTAGVFALGLVTLLLSRFVVPERLYPWLTLASGVLVVAVGASVLAGRVRRARGHQHHHHHHHDQPHEHDHGRGGLLGVGIAAGLLPCPSALVVLLSAIALHRVGFGLALIVAFSLGLAATVTAIGLLAVLARRAFGRLSLNGRLVRALPAASAFLILAVGVGITVRALPEVF
jgi:ABC-type nickel/cobalt efflux system permease component RcnA